MTGRVYRPEVIEWVRRTTSAQNLPEHVTGDIFQARFAALFGVPDAATQSRASSSIDPDQ